MIDCENLHPGTRVKATADLLMVGSWSEARQRWDIATAKKGEKLTVLEYCRAPGGSDFQDAVIVGFYGRRYSLLASELDLNAEEMS